MKKLLLLSVIIASIVIPARAAKIKNPRLALKKTLVQMAIADAIYACFLIFVWHRL